MKQQAAQMAAKHPEILVGMTMTGTSFGLMELNALLGAILAGIGILYTIRKWYLMEKHKKDMSRPPFNVRD